MLGPVLGYSSTWQLAINTITTIVTFLMVFLIQRSQNKESLAIQLKLNEIVAAMNGASNQLINVEDLSEADVQTLKKHYAKLRELAKKEHDPSAAIPGPCPRSHRWHEVGGESLCWSRRSAQLDRYTDRARQDRASCRGRPTRRLTVPRICPRASQTRVGYTDGRSGGHSAYRGHTSNRRSSGPRSAPPKPSSSDGRALALYRQAVADRAANNLISAQTNIKLALAFDRSNSTYRRFFEEVVKDLSKLTHGEPPAVRVLALFGEATTAEALGETDRAIALLEEAIAINKDPRCCNRLGVILIVKKKERARGRELIQRAADGDPNNPTYQHNLKKFSDDKPKSDKKQKPSSKSTWLSMFGRREG